MCQTGKIATPSWVVQLSERLEYHGLVGLYLKPIENITALLYRVFLRGRGFKSGFYKRYASLSDRRYEKFSGPGLNEGWRISPRSLIKYLCETFPVPRCAAQNSAKKLPKMTRFNCRRCHPCELTHFYSVCYQG